jgi:hypothetical protein
MKKSDGGPAFPHNTLGHPETDGMSLRAYIATAALQGMLAADEGVSDPHGKMIDPALGTWRKLLAKDACSYADALLAELEK